MISVLRDAAHEVEYELLASTKFPSQGIYLPASFAWTDLVISLLLDAAEELDELLASTKLPSQGKYLPALFG